MDIASAELGNFYLMRLTGDLNIDNSIDFSNKLKDIFTNVKQREFVLDLSKVGEVDATGMAMLISTAAWGRGKGHRIDLFAPAPHIQKRMEEQEINGLFPMIENDVDLFSRLPD